MNEEDELNAAFKLVCKKCGSEDVSVDIERSCDYGDASGYRCGKIILSCNSCKQNEVDISI